MRDRLVAPRTLRKLINWRCPMGCDAGIDWNQIRTVATCRQCKAKSMSRAEDILENNHRDDGVVSDYDPYN